VPRGAGRGGEGAEGQYAGVVAAVDAAGMWETRGVGCGGRVAKGGHEAGERGDRVECRRGVGCGGRVAKGGHKAGKRGDTDVCAQALGGVRPWHD
jgi:hypothetical protein